MITERYSGMGVVFYDGPSQIDGAPIIGVATGFDGSRNTKTGSGLVQTYIVRRDMTPIEASLTRADRSICGDCEHAGTATSPRSCYVNLAHGPRTVYDAFGRGVYGAVDVETAAEMMRSRRVRLGTYGDPAALPLSVWDSVLAYSGYVTGYTHQWRSAPEFARYCMASADSTDDRAAARMLGFRTFRVRGADDPLEHGEVQCPAAKEAGFRTTCDACFACGGNSAKAKADISIVAHGAFAKHYLQRHTVI